MATDPKLESYLSALERALKPLPVSDRADIVTEIKSHVLSALERDPQSSIDSVLNALGSAESVANRYLMERGHATVKPPISPIVKWLVIGFLGTVAMILLFFGLLIFRFSPVVSVDGKNEHVSLFGGMISIDGKNEKISIGGHVIDDDHAPEVKVQVTDGPNPQLNIKITAPSNKASPAPTKTPDEWDKE